MKKYRVFFTDEYMEVSSEKEPPVGEHSSTMFWPVHFVESDKDGFVNLIQVQYLEVLT